jgi:hypothetical protein
MACGANGRKKATTRSMMGSLTSITFVNMNETQTSMGMSVSSSANATALARIMQWFMKYSEKTILTNTITVRNGCAILLLFLLRASRDSLGFLTKVFQNESDRSITVKKVSRIKGHCFIALLHDEKAM